VSIKILGRFKLGKLSIFFHLRYQDLKIRWYCTKQRKSLHDEYSGCVPGFSDKREIFIGVILSHLVVIVSRYENRKARYDKKTEVCSLPPNLPRVLPLAFLYFLVETRLSSFAQSLSVDGGNFRNRADPEVAKFHWRLLFAPRISNLTRVSGLTPSPCC
jgi:hypothetical protein